MDGLEPVPVGGRFTYELTPSRLACICITATSCRVSATSTKDCTAASSSILKKAAPPAHELYMLMNAFDTNFDGSNEVYAVNTVGFHFQRHPIPVKANQLIRILPDQHRRV